MAGLFDGTPLERPVTCDNCERPVAECNCAPPAAADAPPSPAMQRPRVRRERRRGKWCTVVAGLAPENLKPLLKSLRGELGVGGGVSDDELVLQGDRREEVVAKLIAQGYQAKAAGG